MSVNTTLSTMPLKLCFGYTLTFKRQTASLVGCEEFTIRVTLVRHAELIMPSVWISHKHMPCSQSTGLSPELYEFQLLIISLVSIYVSLQIQYDHFQMNIEQDSLRTLPQLRAGSGQDSQRTEGLRHVCECRYRCRHRYPSIPWFMNTISRNHHFGCVFVTFWCWWTLTHLGAH